MKKTQLIIALTAVFTTVPHTNSYALSLTIGAACAEAGVTESDTCYTANVPPTVLLSSNCTSASSGCVFRSCGSTCRCSSTECPSTPPTNCNNITCNPVWGAIDNTTHIQTGKTQHPDTSNNCKCIADSGFIGSTIYRCIAGYYDSTTGMVMVGSKPTCAKCPSLGNNNVAGQSYTGFTETPLNKGITSCYIPYDTEITDDTGTYKFTKPGFSVLGVYGCYYTNN